MLTNWFTCLLTKCGIPGFSIKGNKNQKVIYLTLDDGPNPKTSDLLLWMESQNIRATHFWVGERISKTDFNLQNLHGQYFAFHGYSHNRYFSLTTREIENEISQLKTLGLKNNIGFQSWFRTPYGSWKPGLGKNLKQEGFSIIFWSYLFKDWLDSFEPIEIQNQKSQWLQNGAILVFHDKPEFHDRVKECLKIVQEICNQNGFELSCLPSPN